MAANVEKEYSVKEPIFIIGTGRCGSTIFHQMMSEHPEVAWLSWLCDRYPRKPSINRFVMRSLDIPFLGTVVAKKLWPGECYHLWDTYFRGFGTACRDLHREDVSLKAKRDIRKVMGEVVTKNRSRLLVKITGWPRIGFLKEIFPDAKFVHVVRDGRAVANSCLTTSFWEGWKGPYNWRWGRMQKECHETWVRSGESFLALAAIEWKTLMDATEASKQELAPEDYLEIRYEDLCEDVDGTTRSVVEFAGLTWTTEFQKRIGKYRLNNKDYKWRNDLTHGQQRVLEDVLSESLLKYGYVDRAEAEKSAVTEPGLELAR